MAAKKKTPVSTTQLVPSSVDALATLAPPPETSSARIDWVKSRLVYISREAGARYFENGKLLVEIRKNKYWKEWDYESFNDAIDQLHQAGQLEYGARNAYNFIKIVEMQQAMGIPEHEFTKIPISKLREICSLKSPQDRQKLLSAASDMDVAEVQIEAKKLRHKAKGKTIDPLTPVTLMMTATMRTFFKECIQKAKQVYAVNPDTPDAAILVDMILPEWFNGVPQLEAETIEAEVA